MSTATGEIVSDPEITVLSNSFQELIVARGSLRLQIATVGGSKLALRRLRRAEKAIQRQALNLLTDLYALGLSRSEVGVIYRRAEEEDRRRNGTELTNEATGTVAVRLDSNRYEGRIR